MGFPGSVSGSSTAPKITTACAIVEKSLPKHYQKAGTGWRGLTALGEHVKASGSTITLITLFFIDELGRDWSASERIGKRQLAETQGFEPWIQVLARMLP